MFHLSRRPVAVTDDRRKEINTGDKGVYKIEAKEQNFLVRFIATDSTARPKNFESNKADWAIQIYTLSIKEFAEVCTKLLMRWQKHIG
jgi:hypothetical protein